MVWIGWMFGLGIRYVIWLNSIMAMEVKKHESGIAVQKILNIDVKCLLGYFRLFEKWKRLRFTPNPGTIRTID